MCAEVCPSCRVSIVRTGGCKFMECIKCKYQFCWWCLDEFYTAYHLRQDMASATTTCPMRYCLLHSIEVAGAALIFVKLTLLSDTVMNCTYYVFYVAKLLVTHGIFIFQAIFIRD